MGNGIDEAAIDQAENTPNCFVVSDANGSGVEKKLQLLPILGETFRISSMDNFLRVVGT